MNKKRKAFHLTSALLKGEWAIDPIFAIQHMPLVENLIDNKQVSFSWGDDDDEEEEAQIASMYVFDAGQWRRSEGNDSASLARVQLMSIEGPMFKYGSCGSFGTVDYTEALLGAYRDKQVAATVINWDSPGGQLDGTPSLHDAVANPAKPTVSRIDNGMMASAAFWGAAPSDAILASQPTDIVGSIGVYTTLRDARDYYKRIGIEMKDVYSNRSGQKNIEYRRALEGDLGPLRARLDKSADTFIATVKKARGKKLTSDAWTEGGTYTAQEGKVIGLIDDMASLEDALTLALDMAKTRNKKSFSNLNQNNNMGLVQNALDFIKGNSSSGSEAEATNAAVQALGTVAEERQTQIVALQGQLATARQELTTARAELTTANTQVTTLQGQVTTLTADRDKWKEKAESYGSQPGETPTQKASEKKEEGAPSTPKAEDSFSKAAAEFGL